MLRKSNFRNLSHIKYECILKCHKKKCYNLWESCFFDYGGMDSSWGTSSHLSCDSWNICSQVWSCFSIVTIFFLKCIYVIYFYSVWRCIHNCIDLHTLLLQVTECMVTISIPISLYHTWDHLTNFRKPKLQSQVVRITWIVSWYCIIRFDYSSC